MSEPCPICGVDFEDEDDLDLHLEDCEAEHLETLAEEETSGP